MSDPAPHPSGTTDPSPTDPVPSEASAASDEPGASVEASSLKIMILAGGPDAERDVSLKSGIAVYEALADAGHHAMLRDCRPDDTAAIDGFAQWQGDAIFVAMHGPWGEGGGLQQLLDRAGHPYTGSREGPASDCMNKQRTKALLRIAGIDTPESQVLRPGEATHLEPPLVIKPLREGSSIGVLICHRPEDAAAACQRLHPGYGALLAERWVGGTEVTVGVIADERGELVALPVIRVDCDASFFDYQSKYVSERTRRRFDTALPTPVLDQLQNLSVRACQRLGVRHLARVDFIVDGDHRPWLLEVNTIPGMTDHSLLPLAAARVGLDMPALCDRLVRRAIADEVRAANADHAANTPRAAAS